MSSLLSQILVNREFLTPDDLAQWNRRATAEGSLLDETLLRHNVFSRDQLIWMLEDHFSCPSVDLRSIKPDEETLQLIPKRLAERNGAFPVEQDNGRLRVALIDPSNTRSVNALSEFAGSPVVPAVALPSEIERAIARHYATVTPLEEAPAQPTGKAPAPAMDASAPEATGDKIPSMDLEGKEVVALVDTIVETAAGHQATDIHLLPAQDRLWISLRIDGVLYTVGDLPPEQAPAIISRIKILSGMDIAEHRLPQDGRFTRYLDDKFFDFRVSLIPAQFGERVSIRILSKSLGLLDLNELNLPPAIWQGYRDTLESPQGFFLVTGPTGCGKSTTLYATLNAMDRTSLNVISLEDPIEYTLSRMTQIQIKEEIGFTFASALRSVLRHDPDVVLVGEIRDLETVEIAYRAALTGHKVFSTLHTNDAPQAITRLIDMGVHPYMIAATLKGVLAQRLVRVNCEHCKAPYKPSEIELSLMGYPLVESFQRGRGCRHCSQTGYLGRMGIFEYFRMDENVQRLVLERPTAYRLRQAAEHNGMIPLTEFARRTVLEGKTTVEEIQRTVLSNERSERMCDNCRHVIAIDYANCPYCGHAVMDSCPGCGKPIDPAWRNCAACGIPLERSWEQHFCRQCLAPIEPGATACSVCGHRLG